MKQQKNKSETFYSLIRGLYLFETNNISFFFKLTPYVTQSCFLRNVRLLEIANFSNVDNSLNRL